MLLYLPLGSNCLGFYYHIFKFLPAAYIIKVMKAGNPTRNHTNAWEKHMLESRTFYSSKYLSSKSVFIVVVHNLGWIVMEKHIGYSSIIQSLAGV